MRQTAADWLRYAEIQRAEAAIARRRQHRARVAGGYPIGGVMADRAIDEVIAALGRKHSVIRFGSDAQPLSPSYKLPSRVVPDDCVAIRAEALLGLVAQLAKAQEKVALLEAIRAEEIATRLANEQTHASLAP